jgi:hypothetical protein
VTRTIPRLLGPTELSGGFHFGCMHPENGPWFGSMDAPALAARIYLTAADLRHVAAQLGVARAPATTGLAGARRWLGALVQSCPELTLAVLVEYALPDAVLQRLLAAEVWCGELGAYLWRGAAVSWTAARRTALAVALARSGASGELDRLVERGELGEWVARAFDEKAVTRHRERWQLLDEAVRTFESAPRDAAAHRRLMQAAALLGLKAEASAWCSGTHAEGAWAPWSADELASIRSAISALAAPLRSAPASAAVPVQAAHRPASELQGPRRVRRRKPRAPGHRPSVDWLAVAEAKLAAPGAQLSYSNPPARALAAVLARTPRHDASRVLHVLQRAFAPSRDLHELALDLLCARPGAGELAAGGHPSSAGGQAPRGEEPTPLADEGELDDDAAIELLVAKAAAMGFEGLERDHVIHRDHDCAIELEAVLAWHSPRVALVFDLDERTAERWAARGYRAVDADAAFADAGTLGSLR